MFVALEGADGTGKSSLAEAIAQRLAKTRPEQGVAVHHHGPPVKSPLEEYGYDYEGYRAGDGNLIVDRLHYGPLVYSQLYRKTGPYGELGLAGFRWVELLLMARGCRTFIVDQEVDVLQERLERRGEDFIDLKDLAFIRNRYLELSRLGASVSGVVTPEGDTTDIEEMIIEACTAYSYFSEWAVDVPSYVGHTQPRAVLVGEKRGGKPPHETEGAFMPTQRTNSGSYLLEALPDPYWKSIGLMNGCEHDPGLVRAAVPTTKFVALGQKAHQVLEKGGIPHATVPHPQKVKRFHHKMKEEYGQLIEQVTGTEEDRLSWPN